VGTGPFRLAQWKRSSKIVLQRNPGFREVFYDENPPRATPHAQATAARLKGRRLPLIDRVEVSIIEEVQPRWLAFLNAGQDLIEALPAEFSSIAIPNNQLAPNLRKQGIHMERYPRADVAVTLLRHGEPGGGGLRAAQGGAAPRHLAGAWTWTARSASCAATRPSPARGPSARKTYGYDPAYKSEMSTYDPARAKALLDLHDYADRNGDGWARPARRQAARAGVRHPARPAKPPAHRAVEKNMDALAHPHRVQDRQVAGEPEGQPRRQAR
jgi:ABC-type transport system substrate-binding protein